MFGMGRDFSFGEMFDGVFAPLQSKRRSDVFQRPDAVVAYLEPHRIVPCGESTSTSGFHARIVNQFLVIVDESVDRYCSAKAVLSAGSR